MTCLLGILVGCGAEAQTPKEQVVALESSGAIPKLERGDTLTGTDANTNGVRDDIEAYIVANYTNGAQRAAAMQYAKGMQKTLTVGSTDVQTAKEVQRQSSLANKCLYSTFDGSAGTKHPAAVGTELEKMTTNTKQRLLAYLAFNKALDGTSWGTPAGDGCE
ncbi:MAG: hypothetical protein QM520_01220 [Gammaproteobacteria bacterium]|nr:hypothetical protein [Gammaproteobacteria bacterium]